MLQVGMQTVIPVLERCSQLVGNLCTHSKLGYDNVGCNKYAFVNLDYAFKGGSIFYPYRH